MCLNKNKNLDKLRYYCYYDIISRWYLTKPVHNRNNIMNSELVHYIKIWCSLFLKFISLGWMKKLFMKPQ